MSLSRPRASTRSSADLAGYLLTERKRSPLTVAAYARDLKEFSEFLRQARTAGDLPDLAARRDGLADPPVHRALVRYARAMTPERSAASSRRSARSTGFLKSPACLESDPALAIPGPSVAKRKPAPLKVDEVMQLLRTSLAGRTDAARLRDRGDLGALLRERHPACGARGRPARRRRSGRADDSRDRQGQQGAHGRDQSHRRGRDRSLPARATAQRRSERSFSDAAAKG